MTSVSSLISVCKPVVIAIMILLIMDFCGVFCMISYTAKIFTESGTEFHPNQAAVVVGFIQLIGTYVSTITVDHVGRKVSYQIRLERDDGELTTGLLYLGTFQHVLYGNRSRLHGAGYIHLLEQF